METLVKDTTAVAWLLLLSTVANHQDQENSLLYSTALWQTLHTNSMCTTSNDNTYHMHLPQELPQVHVLQGQCQKRLR